MTQKRPDGSLIKWVDGAKVEIKADKYTRLYYVDEEVVSTARGALYRGLTYLKEDTDLAEKKAQMLTKQLEIQFEIDRLNAENSWVEDWSNNLQKKYSLYHDTETNLISTNTDTDNYGSKYMSHSTAETILAKYSQDELKQYLGIII